MMHPVWCVVSKFSCYSLCIVSVLLKGELRYAVEGYLPGTNFFEVDERTAKVKTTANLNNDNRQYTVSSVKLPLSPSITA